MSDQLGRIEKMLTALTEKTDKIEEKVDKIEEDMATRSDIMSVSETLETIATSSAALEAQRVEDKAEAGYVVLESLFHGMEDRVANLIRESEERMTKQLEQNQLETNQKLIEMQMSMNSILQVMNQGFEVMNRRLDLHDQRFEQTFDIMRSWVTKQTSIEEQIQELKKKITGQAGTGSGGESE